MAYKSEIYGDFSAVSLRGETNICAMDHCHIGGSGYNIPLQ